MADDINYPWGWFTANIPNEGMQTRWKDEGREERVKQKIVRGKREKRGVERGNDINISHVDPTLDFSYVVGVGKAEYGVPLGKISGLFADFCFNQSSRLGIRQVSLPLSSLSLLPPSSLFLLPSLSPSLLSILFFSPEEGVPQGKTSGLRRVPLINLLTLVFSLYLFPFSLFLLSSLPLSLHLAYPSYSSSLGKINGLFTDFRYNQSSHHGIRLVPLLSLSFSSSSFSSPSLHPSEDGAGQDQWPLLTSTSLLT